MDRRSIRLWERIKRVIPRLPTNFRHAFTKYYHLKFCPFYLGSLTRILCEIFDEFIEIEFGGKNGVFWYYAILDQPYISFQNNHGSSD